MSSFSIIIPMLGSQQDFEATLGSVLRYRLPKHQIVVVHNRDECDPYGLAEEVDFVQCDAGVSLATLIPRGVERATGEVIQILRPGMEVTENWFIHGIRLMLTDGVAAVSPTIRGAEDSHKILATGVNVDFGFSRLVTSDPKSKILAPTTWAGFYSASVLKAWKGWDSSLNDEYLDIDLGLALKRLGYRALVASDCLCLASSPDLMEHRPSRESGYHAQRMIQRYAGKSSRASGGRATFALLADLAGALMQPRRLFQALGRSAAKSNLALDGTCRRNLKLVQQDLQDQATEKQDGAHQRSKFSSMPKAA